MKFSFIEILFDGMYSGLNLVIGFVVTFFLFVGVIVSLLHPIKTFPISILPIGGTIYFICKIYTRYVEYKEDQEDEARKNNPLL